MGPITGSTNATISFRDYILALIARYILDKIKQYMVNTTHQYNRTKILTTLDHVASKT